jgi:hypothetical protein
MMSGHSLSLCLTILVVVFAFYRTFEVREHSGIVIVTTKVSPLLLGKGSKHNQGTTTLMVRDRGFFGLKPVKVKKGRTLQLRGLLHDDQSDDTPTLQLSDVLPAENPSSLYVNEYYPFWPLIPATVALAGLVDYSEYAALEYPEYYEETTDTPLFVGELEDDEPFVTEVHDDQPDFTEDFEETTDTPSFVGKLEDDEPFVPEEHDEQPDVTEDEETKDTPSFVGKLEDEEPDVPEHEETRNTPSFVGKLEEPVTPEDEVYTLPMGVKLLLTLVTVFLCFILFSALCILCIQLSICICCCRHMDENKKRSKWQRHYQEQQVVKLEDQSPTRGAVTGGNAETGFTFDLDKMSSDERDAYFFYLTKRGTATKTNERESSEVVDGSQGKATISDATSLKHVMPAVVAV